MRRACKFGGHHEAALGGCAVVKAQGGDQKVRCFVLDDVNVDVLTYGPGLHMLRADTSPVKDRITSLKDAAFPSKIQFSVCGNTKEGMEKKEGQPITVLSEAVVVPSGVVRLMELQEKGWSYVRP